MFRTTARSLSVLAGLIVAGGAALVPDAAQALTNGEYVCQRSIGTAGLRFEKRTHLAHLRCENAEVSGGGCDQVARDQTITAAASKLGEKLANKCGAITLENLGFPAGCADTSGPPFTESELFACMRDSHLDRVGTAVATEYPPRPGAVTSDEAFCQRKIGDAGQRFIKQKLKLRQRCRNKQLANAIGAGVDCRSEQPPVGPGTGNANIDKKMAASITKLQNALAGACAGITLEHLGFPGQCSDPDGAPFSVANLQDCGRDMLGQQANALYEIEYALVPPTPTPTPTATPTSTPTPTLTLPLPPSPTASPSFGDLAGIVAPTGDADGDGFSNTLELAECSNPADPASTPENDHSLCANATIFSDTLGPAWGSTNQMSEPTYNAAVTALMAQNAADCGAYCATTPNIGSPEMCDGNWPWSGTPEHGFYEGGETIEANFTDENGDRLEATIFLPPGVTCLPDGEPVCDGVTDTVTCSASGGATYPAVIITEGFTGSQRMYFWAAHRLAEQGYITMTFDVSGQGRSQGTFPNGDATIAADLGSGGTGGNSGFSRDTGAAVNWFVSATNPARDLIAVDSVEIVNQATGASNHTEPYVLGVAGHSAGATGVIAYQQSTETTLYPVRARAVVGWSPFDAEGTIGNVPIQLQSGDEDSGFIQPPGSGNVNAEVQLRYDRLAGDRDLDSTSDFTPHDRQIIMTEAGTHLDYSQVPWAYTPTWAEEVQYHYTLAWFDKYLRGDLGRTMGDVVGGVIQSVDAANDYVECTSGANCYTATQRLMLSHVHLSAMFPSRYDLGAAGTCSDMKGGGC